MKIAYDNDGVGNLILSKPEHDKLPEDTRKKMRTLARDKTMANSAHIFSFYGNRSLELAYEICQYYGLTLETPLYDMDGE